MKKLDEMDRNIQLRSEELSYKIMLLTLSLWTFYNCWQGLINGEKYSPLPGLIVCLAVSVQGFSQAAIKHKMVDGDEEYKEPDKFLLTAVAAAAVAAVILSIGTYFLTRV